MPLEFQGRGPCKDPRNLILMVDETTANLPLGDAWGGRRTAGPAHAHGSPVHRSEFPARGELVQRARRLRDLRSEHRGLSCPSLAGLAETQRSARTAGHRSTAYPCPAAAARGHGNLRRAGTRRLCLNRRTARRPASTVFQRLLAQNLPGACDQRSRRFGKRAVDGSYRSGVMLSDGLLLSAAEIALMESVPDLVFLNCCHLAQRRGGNGNRLAAGLSRNSSR